MAMIKFGDMNEMVVTREEFPLSTALEVLHDETIAIVGYGVQGPAQGLNLRDNGFNVIVGQRSNTASWDKAIKDGWEPQKNLFSLEEACKKATIICYLLSDAAQMQCWDQVKPYLTAGKTLCFSHGFAVTYAKQTQVVPPAGIDVVLVAPKGSGRSVRKLFLEGKGINSSYAIYQDATRNAEKKALALGIGVGSGYLFKTTFRHEVYSDLVGERGVLMGGLAGLIAAQYEVLRKKGHSPSEAFNETVEELTQSLIPLISENGMDWMFANCSTTAQHGALKWMKPFKEAALPIFDELYESVENGTEAAEVIADNSQSNYRQKLDDKLTQLRQEEIWRTGEQVRKLRPNVKV